MSASRHQVQWQAWDGVCEAARDWTLERRKPLLGSDESRFSLCQSNSQKQD